MKAQAGRPKPWLVASLLASTFAGIAVAKGGPTTWATTFVIDNQPGVTVSGDAGVGSPATYKDYRLATPSADDPNFCIQANQSSAGDLFIRLNRKLDGDAGYQYCDLYAPSTTRQHRQFTVHVTVASVCDELTGNIPGFTAPDGFGGCYVTGGDKPRIRISNDVFAKKTTSTPVSFLEASYSDADVSYVITADSNASVVANGLPSNVRIVQYNGSAHLVKFVAGSAGTQTGAAFPLAFSISITRTAVQ